MMAATIRVSNGEGLSSVLFTSSTILKKLRKLKPDTSSGPDGIRAVLLKILVHHFHFLSPNFINFFVHMHCAQGMETGIGNAHFQ